RILEAHPSPGYTFRVDHSGPVHRRLPLLSRRRAALLSPDRRGLRKRPGAIPRILGKGILQPAGGSDSDRQDRRAGGPVPPGVASSRLAFEPFARAPSFDAALVLSMGLPRGPPDQESGQ